MKEQWLYTIVWGNTTSELCEKLNKEYLVFGWELQGGVSQSITTTLGQDRKIYIQAVKQKRLQTLTPPQSHGELTHS